MTNFFSCGRALALAVLALVFSLAAQSQTGVIMRGDNTYAAISAGGATLQLVATNTATQTIGAGTSTATFNITVSAAPSGASFNGTTFTAGSTGLYLINVSLGGTVQAVAIAPVFVVNGTTIGYGAGISNTNFPNSVITRATGTMTVSLTAGDTVVIQIASGAISNTTNLTTDGTTRLMITKLN